MRFLWIHQSPGDTTTNTDGGMTLSQSFITAQCSAVRTATAEAQHTQFSKSNNSVREFGDGVNWVRQRHSYLPSCDCFKTCSRAHCRHRPCDSRRCPSHRSVGARVLCTASVFLKRVAVQQQDLPVHARMSTRYSSMYAAETLSIPPNAELLLSISYTFM